MAPVRDSLPMISCLRPPPLHTAAAVEGGKSSDMYDGSGGMVDGQDIRHSSMHASHMASGTACTATVDAAAFTLRPVTRADFGMYIIMIECDYSAYVCV